MKEEKRITQADIDGAEVKLRPIAGVQPRVYLPLAYSLALAALLFLVFILPGIKRFGSYVVFSGSPDKAAVYVADEYRGSSAAGIFLKAGTYSIRIEHEGFAPQTMEVKVGGRLYGSLFFPKRQTLRYSLEPKDTRGYLASAFSEYAGWSLAGKPSALYQIPPVLSDAILALASRGALNPLFPYAKDRLAFAGEVLAAASSAESARDGIKAATLAAASGLPGPLSLIAAARTLLESVGSRPAAAVILNDLLPKSQNPARKTVSEIAARVGQKPKNQGPEAPRRIGSRSVAGINFSMFGPGKLELLGEAPSGSLAPYRAEVPAFGLAATETTVGQWKLFLSAKPEWRAENGEGLRSKGLVDASYMEGFAQLSDNQPVAGISWYAAKAYCEWLTSRAGGAYVVDLPTEAMWESAARLQDSTKNAVWSDSSPKGSQNVASFGFSAATGLADLFGNVWEWNSDSYYPYPALAGGTMQHAEKSVRGGSWANEAAGMDLGKRGGVPADHGSAFLGFRPALLIK